MDDIKNFLVSVGYELDEGSGDQFVRTLKAVDDLAKKAAIALTGLASAMAAVVSKTIVSLDSLNFSADRTGATVENLLALSYALQQSGESSSKAGNLVESFAFKLRTLPTNTSIIRSIGVATKAGGKLRDTTDIILDIVDALKSRTYVQSASIAEGLGISEPDLAILMRRSAQIRKDRQEQKDRYRKFGVDPDVEAMNSALLMRAYGALQMHMGVLVDLAANRITPALLRAVQVVDAWVTSHNTEIIAFLDRFIDAVSALIASAEKWLQTLAPIAISFDRMLRTLTGQDGLTALIEGFGFLFVARIAVRAVAVNKAMAAALIAIVTVFAVRHYFNEATIAGTPADSEGQAASAPGLFGRLVNRARRAVGLPATNRDPATAKDAGPALDRSTFAEELKDPKVKAKLFAMTEAEVGNQGADAQKAVMETFFNRAKARGKTLNQVLSDHGYFPGSTFAEASRVVGSAAMEAKYGKIFADVMNGSNISNYATGNASAGVGFNGGYRTGTFRGEDTGVEGPDLQWAARERRRGLLNAQKPHAPLWTPADKSDWQTKPPERTSLMSSPWDDGADVKTERTTNITVKGDRDPHKTAQVVKREQRRTNTDMITSTAAIG